MKIIFEIAKNELRHLFYSPIAWFIMIVFEIQCAIFFVGQIQSMADWQDIYLANSPSFTQLTTNSITFLTFLKGGVFANVLSNLYLFIPLLTMDVIGRELNSGSIKLLYSSPVNLRQLVIGKYLGIAAFNLLLVLILGIFLIAGAFDIKSVDYGILLSATLGFYLMVCAYSSIGLFMSSLSSYQIVAALSTFVIIFCLSFIGSVWQRYDLIRDLTYFLSLQNRTGKMLVGLITTKDVIYFLLISIMFTGFTLIKLRAGREAKPWYVKFGRYSLVLGVVLIIGYISSRPSLTGYWDVSATKMNTIDSQTQMNLKAISDTTLEVTLYTNLLGSGLGSGLPEARNTSYMSGFWEPYLRFNHHINFKYEYYYDSDIEKTDSLIYRQFPDKKNLKEIAEEMAEAIDADLSWFKTPEEMHKIIDLKPEHYRVVMQLNYKGRKEFLRTYDDPEFWPNEKNVNAVLKRLKNKPPKVYFITGDLERSIYKSGERDFSSHAWGRLGLSNIGFDVDTLNLLTQNIPSDISALILADPKINLDTIIQNKLKEYVASGGNMMIFGKPGKQHVLNPFLQSLGIQLMSGQLVEPTYHETPDKVRPYMTAAASDFSNQLSQIKNELQKGDTTTPSFLLFVGTAGLEHTGDNGFIVKPATMTMPGKTWLKAGSLVVDSTLPPPNPQQGDIVANSFVTSFQLTRMLAGKEQRIAVFGDADFMSNTRQGYIFLGEYIYSWMDYNQNPVYPKIIPPKDTSLLITGKIASMQRITFVWILPGLLLVAATVLLIRRKRK